MDEVLRPHAEAGESPARAGLIRRFAALRRGMDERLEPLSRRADELLIRWDALAQKHRLRPGRFLAVALIVGAVSTAATLYTPACTVSVDGETLGAVASLAQVQSAEDQAADRVSAILGRSYEMDSQIELDWKFVSRKDLTPVSVLSNKLFNQVSQVTRGYSLTLDGETVAVQTSRRGLEDLMESLKAPYVNENTISAEFTTPLELHYGYVDVRQITDDLSQVTALLKSNKVEATIYTVQAGDTASAIAQDQGMTLSALVAMNPGLDADKLLIGQELTVSQSVPYLSVRTVDQVTYEEAVPAPVEYVDDASMYKGDSKVLEPGADGVNQVTAQITYLSGAEQSREVLSTQTVTAPVTKVVAQGTMERPKTAPTGHFIWPVSGPITSRYGYRSLFGTRNFHGGIDIYVPSGTSVKAADGGTVITAEYDRSYGYYVVIRHNNGKTTYYAHNSKLLVHVGDKVYQGQVIAKSGATGNVTGPHCHFEVRINDQRQNPLSYLP